MDKALYYIVLTANHRQYEKNVKKKNLIKPKV